MELNTAVLTDQQSSLSDETRDQLMRTLAIDGFCTLPFKLPVELLESLIAVIDRISDEANAERSASLAVKKNKCVALDRAFVDLMMFKPALQLVYDAFGPMFHLNQSNFISRPLEREGGKNFASSIDWHADGPRPGMFPQVNGVMGLHYLKFGYFLTDLTHGTGGSLEVIRGSHLRPEKDGLRGADFDISRYAKDHVKLHCEAGTVVVFHQALWHAAFPNQSDVIRKSCYYSYCPTWMRPLDREFPTMEQLDGYSAEERWLLGEPRPAISWWLPGPKDTARMSRFARASAAMDQSAADQYGK